MSGAQTAAEVNEALAEVGEPVTLRVPAATASNPWDAPSGSPSDTVLQARVSRFPTSMIDGTLIRATDKRVMLSATDIAPTTAMEAIIRGEVHQIVSVDETNLSGTAVYYIIQARR